MPADSDPGTPRAPRPRPDLLHRWLIRLKRRQTVQALLVWGAVGWAGLQFVDVAASPSTAHRTILISALVVYAAGFVVVVLGAHVVLRGTHPLRSLLVVGVTAVSLATGFVVRGFWSEAAAPGARGPSNGTPAAGPLDSAPPTTGQDRPVVVERAGLQPERSTSPAATSTPTDAERTNESGNPARDSSLRPGDADTGTSPADRTTAVLSRLDLLFGTTDEITITAAYRPDRDRALATYERPIELRLISTSAGYRLRVDLDRQGGDRAPGQMLDFGGPFGDVETLVRIPTPCGERPYAVRATLDSGGGGDAAARVRVELARDAARAAVERALALDRCRVDA